MTVQENEFNFDGPNYDSKPNYMNETDLNDSATICELKITVYGTDIPMDGFTTTVQCDVPGELNYS